MGVRDSRRMEGINSERQRRPGERAHGALLVQGAAGRGIQGRYHIVAEVAAQALAGARIAWGLGFGHCRLCSSCAGASACRHSPVSAGIAWDESPRGCSRHRRCAVGRVLCRQAHASRRWFGCDAARLLRGLAAATAIANGAAAWQVGAVARRQRRAAMAHHKVAVKAECGIDCQLPR